MIFFLATLPNETFVILSSIFKKYLNGEFGYQNVPRSKKGIKSSLDLKGSTFKPFRALDISTIHELLLKIEDETMTIKEAMMQCGDIKKLHKIQQAFVKGMELDTWEKAVEVYPQFATAEKLEPFKHLNFSKAELPPQFLNYCQYIKTPGNVSDINTDKLFSFNYLDCTSIFWKNSVSNISVNAIDTIFTTTTVRFTGFTLAVLDYAQSNDTDTDQVFIQHIMCCILLNYVSFRCWMRLKLQ